MERDFTVVFRVRPSFSVSAQRADGKKEGLISIAEANEGITTRGLQPPASSFANHVHVYLSTHLPLPRPLVAN